VRRRVVHRVEPPLTARSGRRLDRGQFGQAILFALAIPPDPPPVSVRPLTEEQNDVAADEDSPQRHQGRRVVLHSPGLQAMSPSVQRVSGERSDGSERGCASDLS